MPSILRSRAPLKTKIEAWFHLTSPLVHVAIVLLVLLAAPALLVPALPAELTLNPGLAFAIGTLLLVLGTAAACSFYVTSQWAQGISPWQTLWRMPALMAIGIGVSVTNTKAVFEAILGRQSPFVRTPKYAGASASPDDPIAAPRRRYFPARTVELVLGLLMVACFVLTFTRPYAIVGAPFLLLFAWGFLWIGMPSVLGGRGLPRGSGPSLPAGQEDPT